MGSGHLSDTEYLRRCRLLSKGILDAVGDDPWGLPALLRSEWSPKFEQLMRRWLVQGAFRYGRLHDPAKPNWDRMTSVIRRAEEYRKQGAAELLVDIANLCLLEFEEGKPKSFYQEGTTHVEALD